MISLTCRILKKYTPPKKFPKIKLKKWSLWITRGRLVVDRGGEWVKWVKGVKKYKFPAVKLIIHWEVMYSMVAIVNNIVLYI